MLLKIFFNYEAVQDNIKPSIVLLLWMEDSWSQKRGSFSVGEVFWCSPLKSIQVIQCSKGRLFQSLLVRRMKEKLNTALGIGTVQGWPRVKNHVQQGWKNIGSVQLRSWKGQLAWKHQWKNGKEATLGQKFRGRRQSLRGEGSNETETHWHYSVPKELCVCGIPPHMGYILHSGTNRAFIYN